MIKKIKKHLEREVSGFKCKVCNHIYSKIEVDYAKFEPCVKCGNVFKKTGKFKIIYKESDNVPRQRNKQNNK